MCLVYNPEVDDNWNVHLISQHQWNFVVVVVVGLVSMKVKRVYAQYETKAKHLGYEVVGLDGLDSLKENGSDLY